MIQGTTPTHKFNVDIDTGLIDKLRISYEQNGKIVLWKEKKTAFGKCFCPARMLCRTDSW